MKHKKLGLVLVLSIILAFLVTFLLYKSNKIKLVKCLKQAEKSRQETIKKLQNNENLTNQRIISIEQATDKDKDECYTLYAR